MVTYYPISHKKRLELCGYRFIRLFRNVYLVRNYSLYAKKISLYGIAVIREGD